jgi:PAS domain S-box-containing protein
MQLPDESISSTFNVVANAATVAGVVVALFVLVNVLSIAKKIRVIIERLEQVIAPRLGIEDYLQSTATVFEAQPIGIVVCDEKRIIKLVNRETERISGYDRAELIGQAVEILVPDRSKAIHPQLAQGYIVNPSLRPMRGLAIRHKSGVDKPARIMLNRDSQRGGAIIIVAILAEGMEGP